MPMIDNQQALRNMQARRATTAGRLARSMRGGLGALVGNGGRTSGIAPLPSNSTSTQVPGGMQPPPRARGPAEGMLARAPGPQAGAVGRTPTPVQGGVLRPPAPPPTAGSGASTAVRSGPGGFYSADGAETSHDQRYGMVTSPEGVRPPDASGMYNTQPTKFSGAGATFQLDTPESSILSGLQNAPIRSPASMPTLPSRPRTLTASGPKTMGGPVQGGERQAPGASQSQRVVGDADPYDAQAEQAADRAQEQQPQQQQQQPRQEGDYTDQNEADAQSYANQQGQSAQQQTQQDETRSYHPPDNRPGWIRNPNGSWYNENTGEFVKGPEQLAREAAAQTEFNTFSPDDERSDLDPTNNYDNVAPQGPPLVEDPLNPGHYGYRGEDGTFHATNMVPNDSSGKQPAKQEIPGMPDMGNAPQIDQSKIDAMIKANAQERALAESRTLQAALSRAARAGMSPEASTAMTGESQHRSAIAGAQDDARVRYDAEIQNFQANVQYFRDKQQLAADYAKMLAQIGASKDLQDRAIQASAYAAREAEMAQRRFLAYQYEFENRINPNSLLGASLGGLTSIGTAGAYGG